MCDKGMDGMDETAGKSRDDGRRGMGRRVVGAAASAVLVYAVKRLVEHVQSSPEKKAKVREQVSKAKARARKAKRAARKATQRAMDSASDAVINVAAAQPGKAQKAQAGSNAATNATKDS